MLVARDVGPGYDPSTSYFRISNLMDDYYFGQPYGESVERR